MSDILGKLIVKIATDAADFSSGLDSAQSKLVAVGQKMTSVGKEMTLAITTPLLAMGGAAIKAASDLDESRNKVAVVFGDWAGDVEMFAGNAAKSLGQSKQQALEAVGTFGNLFKSMGLGNRQTTEMSTGLVQLASDLASFNNIDPTEALEKLRAGLVGEVEPLRTLGVNLTADDVKAKALAMGLVSMSVDMGKVNSATERLSIAQEKAAEAMKKHGEGSLQHRNALLAAETAQRALDKAMQGTEGDISAAAKAQAAYALILEQTKTAQGDFARTSDGLANSTRIVKAQLVDAAATLGQQLLPIALKAVQYLSSLIERFTALSPETQKWILIVSGIAAAIGPVLVIVGTLISSIGTLIGAFSAMGPVIAILTGPIGLLVAAVVAFGVAYATNFAGIRDITNSVVATLIDWFGKLGQILVDLGRYFLVVVQDGEYLNDWLTHLPAPIRFAVEIVGRLIATVRDLGEAIVHLVKAAVAAFQGDWQTAFVEARAAAHSGANAIKDIFTTLDWPSIGSGIAQGIGSGIRGGWNWVVDAAKGAASAALNAAKSALGISSPSRVAAQQIGRPIAQGIGLGYSQEMERQNLSVENGLNAMLGRLRPATAADSGGRLSSLSIPITINISGGGDASLVGRAAQSGIMDALRQAGLA